MEASLSHTATQQPSIAPSITSSTEVSLLTVQSWMVESLWPLVLPFVDRWLEHDGIWTADEIQDELKSARAQLWCLYCGGIRGIWVTRIECGGRLAVVWGCAGDFQSLKEEAIALYGQIEDWFRSIGCKHAEWC